MSVRSHPTVSVITPTYQRHALLLEAVENVRSQTYSGHIEHVIIADGPDPELRRIFAEWPDDLPSRSIRFVELGCNWTSLLTDSYTAAPVMVGQLIASGELQATWADDERAAPGHIAMMVQAILETGTDFVYPRVAYYQWSDPSYAVAIGCSPPVKGAITHVLYRRELLDKGQGPYRTHVGRAGDWEMVERWMANGATWHFIDTGGDPTFSHRDDRGAPPELYAAPLPEYAK